MAKNRDGFEAGKPVSTEDFLAFKAKRRLENAKAKTKEVRTSTKRGHKGVSEPTGEEAAES